MTSSRVDVQRVASVLVAIAIRVSETDDEGGEDDADGCVLSGVD
jgi:hypothetical protein